MTVTIKTRHGGQKIINNSKINVANRAGGINFYADDGTLLMKGSSEGLTLQDSDGTRRSRLGVQPDGTRDVASVTTKAGVDLVEGS